MAFTNQQLLDCARREVALRKAVYTKRGLTDARHREIVMMQEIADHFQRLVETGGVVLVEEPRARPAP
jgi:hypothetical protein